MDYRGTTALASTMQAPMFRVTDLTVAVAMQAHELRYQARMHEMRARRLWSLAAQGVLVDQEALAA